MSASGSEKSSKSSLDLSSLSKLDSIQRRNKYPVDQWPTRYQPIKTLGKGHDGLCYLCEDTETREIVALKVLNPKRNRKVTEPEIMSHLRHRNIVGMKALHVINNTNFLVLEYCEKGDLCDYVYEHEHLSEVEARKIMIQLVDGVSYMHERGFCHRDLKLDNIFIDKDFTIKIGDFGASCRFDQEVKLTYRCGTTQYNAPELVKNQGYFGDEVDCWALGIILYVMLIGKFPFDCETDMQLLWQVIKGIKFPERPVLTDSVKDLIRLLTDPEPSQRATVAVILEHPWIVNPNIAAGIRSSNLVSNVLSASTSTTATSTKNAANNSEHMSSASSSASISTTTSSSSSSNIISRQPPAVTADKKPIGTLPPPNKKN